MSKFFITNNIDISSRIDSVIEASQYEKCFKWSENGIFAFSTKKLKIDNVNASTTNNGFIIVTGTMVWGDDGLRIDRKVLFQVANAFDGSTTSIRKNAIGNYAAVLMRNGTLDILGEATGYYDIFYYNCDGIWVVSNSLYDIAKVLNTRLSVDINNIAEYVIQKSILLGGTFFKEINRLIGFNYIHIDKNNFQIINEEVSYPLSTCSLEKSVEQYKNASIRFAKKMGHAFGKPTQMMTGGLDCRLLLAAELAAGIIPDLYYGSGNSFITNTFDKDLEIDRMYCEKFNLNLINDSWETPTPVDKYWDEYLLLFGFHYSVYGASKNVFESFMKAPNDFHTLGQVGELYRSLPWIDNLSKNYFTIEEYLYTFYIPDNVGELLPDVNIKTHLYDKLLRICRLYNLDPMNLALEDVFYLSNERRKVADSVMLNLLNLIKYSSYQHVDYDVMCAGRVKNEYLSDSRFMLHCLNAIYPEVLDIPVFSHCSMRKFNREMMSLNSQVNHRKEMIRHRAYWLFGILRWVKQHVINNNSKTNVEMNYLIDSLCCIDKFHILNPHARQDKRNVVNYIMLLKALRTLKK